MGKGRRQEADKVGIRYKITKGGQGGKEAVLMISRKGFGMGKGADTVGLPMECSLRKHP